MPQLAVRSIKLFLTMMLDVFDAIYIPLVLVCVRAVVVQGAVLDGYVVGAIPEIGWASIAGDCKPINYYIAGRADNHEVV